jgi:predicted Zn-ribbon and HTH transcriptional regulator
MPQQILPSAFGRVKLVCMAKSPARQARCPAEAQAAVGAIQPGQDVRGRDWGLPAVQRIGCIKTMIFTRLSVAVVCLFVAVLGGRCPASADGDLRIGLAEEDITPPDGFPMAGYYHERLAEGTLDALTAKAIVFRGAHEDAALVVCDLIGISVDLAQAVRKRASEKTGIAVSNIVVAATHSHTAPDYSGELYRYLGGTRLDPVRAAYVERLISGPADAIAKAFASARPALLDAGSATQLTQVSFNRRFVMRDGSVRTWMRLDDPGVVRAAGPIDSEIGLLLVQSEDGAPRGVVSNFALHLDTVGGLKWSADYPFFVEQTMRKAIGPEVVSIFATGCCGDINHNDPRRRERNTSEMIGNSIGATVQGRTDHLRRLERADLTVKSRIVRLPLQDATPQEVARSVEIVEATKRQEKVDFLEHVTAHKKLMLDQLRHRPPHANSADYITWGLSRTWAGVGEELPVEVTVMRLGDEAAIVCLPGEVFVELELAIKQGSPFQTTIVVELCNCKETIYVPTRAAYAGGSYEVTNSALLPGSGEMLVEAALSLLREVATTSTPE